MWLRGDLYCKCDSCGVILFYIFLMPLTSNINIRAQDGVDGILNVPLGRENIPPALAVSSAPSILPQSPKINEASPGAPSVEDPVPKGRSMLAISIYALIAIAAAALVWTKYS